MGFADAVEKTSDDRKEAALKEWSLPVRGAETRRRSKADQA